MPEDKYYGELVEVTVPRRLAIKLKHILAQNPDADIEGIVRCSECKHLKIINKEPVYAECEKQKLTFLLWQADTREHSCSYGERKELFPVDDSLGGLIDD